MRCNKISKTKSEGDSTMPERKINKEASCDQEKLELVSEKSKVTSQQLARLASIGWNPNNSFDSDTIEDCISTLVADKRFNDNFVIDSLFLIGQGAFGLIFRAVTRSIGSGDKQKYPVSLARYLQRIKRTSKLTRSELLDPSRDNDCLDLVAIKLEQVNHEDAEFNSVGTVHLIREFYILQHLFSEPDARFSMIGFPLPIDFDYIGNNITTKSLDRIMIYDPQGEQNSFKKSYFGKNNELYLKNDRITDKCYMVMEQVGPNLDQWRQFFKKTRANNDNVVFTAQTTLKLMDQVLCRLLVMHRKNVVHLDLKPDNICMGIGKMCNTAYLIDFGLSRICSDIKPAITLGSRRYMALSVLDMKPTNYMMDIESWFYILIDLLCGDLPWAEAILSKQLAQENVFGESLEERTISMVGTVKRMFWGDDANSKKLWDELLKKFEHYHKAVVPDIGTIMTDIFEHVKRMRNDFSLVNNRRMLSDIKDEESDLFFRYRQLRKLLLYPYECDFYNRDSVFSNDKDMRRRQIKRRGQHKMLRYISDGRNWHWDWDEWFAEDFPHEMFDD